MTISKYLVEQRQRLVQNHKLGFSPDAAKIPAPNLIHRLADMRREDFLRFR